MKRRILDCNMMGKIIVVAMKLKSEKRLLEEKGKEFGYWTFLWNVN